MWLDDRLDVRVTRLVEALQSGYQFQKTDFPGGDASFAPVLEGGLQNPDAAPTGRPVKSRNLRTGVRTATASQAPPVHQRNLRPRKPRVVVIDSLSSSSSEDGQREGPSEPVRCTHVDLKPWLDQKFEQLAKSFRNHVDELFRNSSCSRCGLSEPRVERARKRKSDEDRSVPSGSFKGVDPEAVPSKRMAKRPKQRLVHLVQRNMSILYVRSKTRVSPTTYTRDPPHRSATLTDARTMMIRMR